MWTLVEVGWNYPTYFFSSFDEAFKKIGHMKFTHIEPTFKNEDNGTTYFTKDGRIFVIEYWPEKEVAW